MALHDTALPPHKESSRILTIIRDTWAIIETMVTIGSIIVALGAIAINQNSQLNTPISDLRTETNSRFTDLRSEIGARFTDRESHVDNLRTDVRQMNDRLRGVKIKFAKVDQRLLTLERAVIPAADSEN